MESNNEIDEKIGGKRRSWGGETKKEEIQRRRQDKMGVPEKSQLCFFKFLNS